MLPKIDTFNMPFVNELNESLFRVTSPSNLHSVWYPDESECDMVPLFSSSYKRKKRLNTVTRVPSFIFNRLDLEDELIVLLKNLKEVLMYNAIYMSTNTQLISSLKLLQRCIENTEVFE